MTYGVDRMTNLALMIQKMLLFLSKHLTSQQGIENTRKPEKTQRLCFRAVLQSAALHLDLKLQHQGIPLLVGLLMRPSVLCGSVVLALF